MRNLQGDDQIIDAAMARALHPDACRDHTLVAWVVLWDLPAHPNRYAARLATSGQVPSPYLLLADTLGGIREMLRISHGHGATRRQGSSAAYRLPSPADVNCAYRSEI
jgi:hypothetical protein